MKSDVQLQLDVIDELRWEPSIATQEIGAAVKDGVVTLAGYVQCYAQKVAAERAAARVAGVKAVADDLQVRLPSELERSDTEIAHAAVESLAWDALVPDDRLQVKVANGWVTLEGEVEWQFQREAAERCIQGLIGVRGVTDRVVVHPAGDATAEVTHKIKDALRRSAEIDAARITVESHDGSVTLRGSVRSWAEREDAERAAWSAPGITKVVDQIAIRG